MDYLTEQARRREEVVQASKVFFMVIVLVVIIVVVVMVMVIIIQCQKGDLIKKKAFEVISKSFLSIFQVQPPDYLSIADSGLPSYEAAIRLNKKLGVII